MAQQGLSIPKDLSLITLASEPYYEHIFPKPSHYASDPRNLARDIVRQILPIVNGKNSRSFEKLLSPDYITGETIFSI